MLAALAMQSTPPNTIPYLIVGYAIIGGIGLIYVITLLLRQRGLMRDLEVIDRLQQDDEE